MTQEMGTGGQHAAWVNRVLDGRAKHDSQAQLVEPAMEVRGCKWDWWTMGTSEPSRG